MKLLVFAHTPPPHHGQSFMVQQMLEGFGGDQRDPKNRRPNPHGIECYHVNARVSKHLEDIGGFRFGKFVLMLGYCVQAIWCRFRYGVENLYYVPAPGKRNALYRDWLVMALCRPFFKRLIFHWHASGMSKWLETVPLLRTRSITYRLAGQPDLSIVLANCSRPDANKLWSRRVKVVGNGIPDPCPDFDSAVLPRRQARFAARMKLLGRERELSSSPASAQTPLSASPRLEPGKTPAVAETSQTSVATGAALDAAEFRVLFLAHCIREKGLFDTLDGVALANKQLRETNSPIRMSLTVAGEFVSDAERKEFETRIAQPDLHDDYKNRCIVTYKGFVTGTTKRQLFVESDCFCFPTYYTAESFPLVLVEALAFGLSVVATRWRAIPEILPEGYSWVITPQAPQEIAAALVETVSEEMSERFRDRFKVNFRLDRSLTLLAKALHELENQPLSTSRLPAGQTLGLTGDSF